MDFSRKCCSGQLSIRDLLMLLQTEFLAELMLWQNSVAREWSLLSQGTLEVWSPLTRSKNSSWSICQSQCGAKGHSLTLHAQRNFILYFKLYYLIPQLYLIMCFILQAILVYDCSLGWINLLLVHHVWKACFPPLNSLMGLARRCWVCAEQSACTQHTPGASGASWGSVPAAKWTLCHCTTCTVWDQQQGHRPTGDAAEAGAMYFGGKKAQGVFSTL